MVILNFLRVLKVYPESDNSIQNELTSFSMYWKNNSVKPVILFHIQNNSENLSFLIVNILICFSKFFFSLSVFRTNICFSNASTITSNIFSIDTRTLGWGCSNFICINLCPLTALLLVCSFS